MLTCEHCKQPIQSKNDLVVMPQWWLIPRPLHKACWGDVSVQHGGLGSLSYQTGMIQGRRQVHIAVNSVFFTALSIVLFLLGVFILFAGIHPTVTSAGQTTVASSGATIIFKLIALVLLSLPLLERIWSYTRIEKKVG